MYVGKPCSVCFMRRGNAPATEGSRKSHKSISLRQKGRRWCRCCKTSRCALHKFIYNWHDIEGLGDRGPGRRWINCVLLETCWLLNDRNAAYTRVQAVSYHPEDNNLSKKWKMLQRPNTHLFDVLSRNFFIIGASTNNSSDFKLMCTTPYLCFVSLAVFCSPMCIKASSLMIR